MSGTLVVSVAVAPLNAEPRASSEQVSQRLSGHQLDVLEVRSPWFRVRGGDGYAGWTHTGYVRSLSPRVAQARFPRVREAIARSAAELFEGTPYQWGGITPWGAECSGLVQSTFGLHGVALPRD